MHTYFVIMAVIFIVVEVIAAMFRAHWNKPVEMSDLRKALQELGK